MPQQFAITIIVFLYIKKTTEGFQNSSEKIRQMRDFIQNSSDGEFMTAVNQLVTQKPTFLSDVGVDSTRPIQELRSIAMTLPDSLLLSLAP
jgi:3-deoxy-D-arabino-heptulosonate 7-phosphate (DAHP) synthase class II